MDYIQFAALLARLIFWAAIVWIIAINIPDALASVAGRETVFDFSFAFSASLALSVTTTGAAGFLYLRNKQLTRRIRELEGQRPPSSPQAEQLPLQEDGGSQ